MTGRKRWRPPWPVQLLGVFAAMALAALTWTGVTHWIIGGPW